MRYEKPEFVEIKMDAEIGSYQNDFDPWPDPRFAEPARWTGRALERPGAVEG
jgi:hypothetical protein